MAETANALADLRLTRREADAFRPAPASPYRRATWGDTGNALLALGRMLLPPTPNEYVWGLSGLAPPPPGAEVRSGVDGYGAEYRMPGGEWQKMEPSALTALGTFAAPIGVGPAPGRVLASGISFGRRARSGRDVVYRTDANDPPSSPPPPPASSSNPNGGLAPSQPFLDIDGFPITAPRVAGRQADGTERALTHAETLSLAQEVAGRGVVQEPMRAPTTGIYYQPRDSWKGQGETTFALGRIAVKDLSDLRTLAHETGHAFDFASRNARIPIPGAIMKEIEHRFAVPGSRGERNPTLESRKREAWALMFERYVTGGASFRNSYPQIAAWMRNTARNDPEIRKRIALNSAAATAFGLGAAEAD